MKSTHLYGITVNINTETNEARFERHLLLNFSSMSCWDSTLGFQAETIGCPQQGTMILWGYMESLHSILL